MPTQEVAYDGGRGASGLERWTGNTRKGPLVGTALSLEGSEAILGMEALRFLKRSACRRDAQTGAGNASYGF